ncbi:hypothetical protein QTN25_009510 [Entamoeba marina]
MSAKCFNLATPICTPSTHVSSIFDDGDHLLGEENDDYFEDKEIYAILHHIPFEDAIIVNEETLVIGNPPSRCENHFMTNTFFSALIDSVKQCVKIKLICF